MVAVFASEKPSDPTIVILPKKSEDMVNLRYPGTDACTDAIWVGSEPPRDLRRPDYMSPATSARLAC
jgi:hypothetical protein